MTNRYFLLSSNLVLHDHPTRLTTRASNNPQLVHYSVTTNPNWGDLRHGGPHKAAVPRFKPPHFGFLKGTKWFNVQVELVILTCQWGATFRISVHTLMYFCLFLLHLASVFPERRSPVKILCVHEGTTTQSAVYYWFSRSVKHQLTLHPESEISQREDESCEVKTAFYLQWNFLCFQHRSMCPPSTQNHHRSVDLHKSTCQYDLSWRAMATAAADQEWESAAERQTTLKSTANRWGARGACIKKHNGSASISN